MPFVMPDNIVLQEFSARVRPIFDLIKDRIVQNQRLKEARNRLLPKLMSGEVEV